MTNEEEHAADQYRKKQELKNARGKILRNFQIALGLKYASRPAWNQKEKDRRRKEDLDLRKRISRNSKS